MEPERSCFDDGEQPVSRYGWAAYLTLTEARLWEALCSQPGRVFSRAELVAVVMPAAVVLERTIDVHIRALRRKLGRAGSRIETIRQQGYRFNPESSS